MRADIPAKMPPPSSPFSAAKFDKGELRERLDPLAYQVTQEGGTERPFSNKYYKHYEAGTYSCVVCGDSLFSSETKYESGSGWPSFYDLIDAKKVSTRPDTSGVGANLLRIVANPHLIRTEVLCKCGSHLGHVFKDGPPPTGKRYCINSSSLTFVPALVEDEDKDEDEDSSDAAGRKDDKKEEVLRFPATINGCGGNGICTIKSKQVAIRRRVEETSERKEESEKETAV